MHFSSDRVPHDNASLAAAWIKENVPARGVIAQSQLVPHVDFFPPIDFSAYQIVEIDESLKNPAKGSLYAVISYKEYVEREKLLKMGFTLAKKFEESPLQKRGYHDVFTNANFGVEIYRRP